MIEFGVVAHGGAGSAEDLSGGCMAACEAAFKMIDQGGGALDAAVEAVRVLEDDGRYNAGCGSVLRLDGETVEMDSAVMDSMGGLGAVINIRGVRNPVSVARAVLKTPHVALAGRGAEAFARKIGASPFPGVSEIARRKHEKVMALMKESRLGEINPLWKDIGPLTFDLLSCDTVGAAAMDRNGVFAVATSTGGALPMMVGRVGDSPMVGCGFYAGPSGAFAATGLGEEIIKRMLAKEVYDAVSNGREIAAACRDAAGLFLPEVPAGLIGISKTGYAVFANRPMAHHVIVRKL